MAPHADIDVSGPHFPVSKDIKTNMIADKTHAATPRTNNPPCSLLRVEGTQILNANNEEVILKGAGVGGACNMENFSKKTVQASSFSKSDKPTFVKQSLDIQAMSMNIAPHLQRF